MMHFHFQNKLSSVFSLILLLEFLFFANAYINVCTPALAKIAYYQQIDIQSFQCEECSWFLDKCVGSYGNIRNIKVFNNTEQKLLFYSLVKTNTRLNTNFIYIVVRGTVPSEVQNWITNLDFLKTNYPDSRCTDCQVHEGFYQAFLTLRNQMFGQIDEALKTYQGKFNISVVGHSLGGAIATFAAIQIKKLWPQYFVELVTYGQPRVGQKNFASFINSVVSRTQRNIHYADIVPHVPPLTMGFKHYNMEYWYDENMVVYKICLAESPSCSDSIPDYDFSIDDHTMDHYKKVTKNAQYNLTCQMVKAQLNFSKSQTNITLPVSVTVHYSGFEVPENILVLQTVDGSNDCYKNYESSVLYEDDIVFGADHYCSFRNQSTAYLSKYFLKAEVYVGRQNVNCSGYYTIRIE